MLKKIFNIIKKILFSAFIIYGFNLIITPLNLIIPLNLITVGFVTLLGAPALLAFIAIYLIVF